MKRVFRQVVHSVAPLLLFFAMSALGAACDPGEDLTQQEPGWDDELRLPLAVDQNSDPHVLEVNLTAREADVQIMPGKPTHLYTYDGLLPGPLLRAREGDRVIVHFKNELPEPTTIHWHGIRLDSNMDGAPPHSQPEIEPGGTFDYDFVVPDAGTFWYHPHVRSAAQVGFGLYGALIVDPKDGPEVDADLGDELVVVLSDISLDDDNQLQSPDASGDLATLFGREGNIVLANGKVLPSIRARPGVRQRWRLINAARSRYFQVDLNGLPMTKIGGDAGFLAHPTTDTKVLVIPGGRAEVVVTPQGNVPTTLAMQWLPFDRGFGTTEFRDPVDVFQVALQGELGESPPLRDTSRPIEPLSAEGATPVPIEFTQTDLPDGTFELGINGVPFGGDPIPATVGETQLWTVTNKMSWSHPFHLHGFFFQPIDDDGVPIGEWVDTADVPFKDGKLRFLVHYDNRPGMWMFHCHILDHADAGMMGMVDLRR